MMASTKDYRVRADKIASWLARQQSGELSPQEMQEFSDWLAESQLHRATYKEYEDSLEVVDSAEVDILAREFERELEAEYAESQKRRVSRFWPALAASITLVIGASITFYGAVLNIGSFQQFATEIGENRDIVLDDGSSARLNTDSRVEVSYSRDRRTVNLKYGEALFEVRRNTDRPFVVHTDYAEVTVTGTVFNVQSFDSYMNLSVISGSVKVSIPDAEATSLLKAGEYLRIDKDGASATGAFDQAIALAWLEGKARYEDRSLEEVVADLNRYFPKPIILAEAAIGKLPVTGEFDLGDQETAVKALSIAFELEIETSADRILLRPAVPMKG